MANEKDFFLLLIEAEAVPPESGKLTFADFMSLMRP